MTAVRLKQAATEISGSAASAVDRPDFTASIWTWWMKSMAGTSFQQASAVDIAAVHVPIAVLTYLTTKSWSAVRSSVIVGSSATVLLFTVVEVVLVAFQQPRSSSSSKSKTERR